MSLSLLAGRTVVNSYLAPVEYVIDDLAEEPLCDDNNLRKIMSERLVEFRHGMVYTIFFKVHFLKGGNWNNIMYFIFLKIWHFYENKIIQSNTGIVPNFFVSFQIK